RPLFVGNSCALCGVDRRPVRPAEPSRAYVGWLLHQDHDAARAYWREYLAGLDGPTPLPGARSAATHAAAHGETYFEIDEPTTEQLLKFAAAQRLTVSTLLQAAWALTLYRYGGVAEVVFGVTVSGRDVDLPGVEGMVGLLINTLPLRVQVGDQPVGEWLQALQAGLQENMRRGFVPLAEIQAQSPLPNGARLF